MADLGDVKKRFEELSSEKEACKARVIQLETKIDVAEKEKDNALKALKEQFGLDSVEEANAKVSQLESEIEAELAECEEYLEKFA